MPITYHKKKVGTGENRRNYYYKRLENGNSKRIRKEVYERNSKKKIKKQFGGNIKDILIEVEENTLMFAKNKNKNGQKITYHAYYRTGTRGRVISEHTMNFETVLINLGEKRYK